MTTFSQGFTNKYIDEPSFTVRDLPFLYLKNDLNIIYSKRTVCYLFCRHLTFQFLRTFFVCSRISAMSNDVKSQFLGRRLTEHYSL